jgi:hypothetical protein
MAPKTSKWRTDDYAVRNDLVQHVIDHFGGTIPSIDAFASEKNKRFPRFWDKHADAFAQDWASEGLLWINPPFDALHRVVEKIRKDGALAIVVAPEWKNMSWWKKLKGMAVAEFLFDVKEPLFEREGEHQMKAPKWKTWAFLVHGGDHRDRLHIREVVARHLQAWPEGRPDQLSVKELDIIEGHCAMLKDSPLCGVCSVVKVGKNSLTADLVQEKIVAAKKTLLDEFMKDVLSGKLPKEPPVRGPFGMAKIELIPGAVPKRQRSFKMTGEREEALKKILEEYCELGWLEPSFSEWGSPCFVVPKKVAHEWRLVVDYRALNQVTKHDSYELPLIADMLQKHSKKRMFTVLDMKKGYHQMPLDPKCRHLTAMVTHMGLWQWRVMPMGAKNGNSAFQRMMEWVLSPFDFAWPFVDDVIIASDGKDFEDLVENHSRLVRAVLERFRELNLVCDLSKAHLFEEEVEFCGHILGHGCRRPAPGKLRALEKWPRPTTVTQLRAFLGFANWYAEYIKGFAEVAAPLQDMLHLKKADAKAGCKKTLKWSSDASIAFEELKQKLLRELKLHLLDPDKDFVIHTDASKVAIGCVVEQEFDGVLRPIAFWSRKLTTSQRNWTPREQETYAVISSLKKFAGWIGLRKVHIITDHECLTSWYKEAVDTPSGPSGRRGRWHETLSKFNLEVSYTRGVNNVPADCMSRWAYPACKALQDCSPHGSLEDALEVHDLI